MSITIEKIRDVDLTFTAPPSKSYTHRALIAAALGEGRSVIMNPLDAEDTRLTAGALRALGVRVTKRKDRYFVTGCDGGIPTDGETTLELENSGTSLRLLASLALLCRHPVVLTGSARMLERPIGPLAKALPLIGGTVDYLNNPGYPPLRVGGRLTGGNVVIDGSISSQFISSVLIAAPYAKKEVEVHVPGLVASASYLDITVHVMQAFGAKVKRDGCSVFRVSNRHHYRAREYAVEGDYSSASYFFAMAAICGGRVTVNNLNPLSVQGDRRFLDALAKMGCMVTYGKDSVTVERDGKLEGITFDMSSSPDTVQTLAVVAAVATGKTTIKGIGHLKYKESDRINGTAERLRALGAEVVVGESSMTIRPGPFRGGTIDPANDHRTAMSFAVLGLGTGGITITNPACVKKSFPGFWDTLRKNGVIP